MNTDSMPKLSKVPFLIGDALLLAAAAWLVWHSPTLDVWRGGLVVAAVAIAGWIGITPFIIEFRARMKVLETAELGDITSKLGDLQGLAARIASASAEWQHVHQSTTQTVTAADQIAEKMIAESRNFGEVLTRMNETEKNHLKLELDKMRRSEGDWLSILVRLFDQIYALHRAGVRSGQRNVADQLTQFQNICLDTVRRVGFVAIVPAAGSTFDEQQHQVLKGEKPANGAAITEIIAPGYSYQSQLLRLPVVAVAAREPAVEQPQTQLSLDETPEPQS